MAVILAVYQHTDSAMNELERQLHPATRTPTEGGRPGPAGDERYQALDGQVPAIQIGPPVTRD